jgi:hypothetical protein
MKQLWTVLLFCALIAAVGCEQSFADDNADQAEVAAEEQPKPIIEIIEIPEELPEHPRLFLTPDRIAELKAWMARDEWAADYVEQFVVNCRERAANVELPTMATDEGGNHAAANSARDFALAYVLSDDIELAKAAADILKAYVPLYPQYGVSYMKGRATSSALGEAEWARNMACAYDLVYNAGVLTDADKKAIEDDVLRPCGQLLTDCNHQYRSNWRAAAMSGLGCIGFAIDDRDLINEAMNGFRNKENQLIRDGMAHHISFAMLSDGIGYERSQGYHSYSLYSYTWLLEAATNSGIDLYHLTFTGHDYDSGADPTRRFGETGPKSIRAMYEAPLYYAFSDGSFATVANSAAMKLERSGHTWYYEAAYRAYGDERFAWLAQQTDTPGRIDAAWQLMFVSPEMVEGRFDLAEDVNIGMTGVHRNLCTFFPAGGYAILRDSTEADALNVNMTFGKYGSGHSHPDKLSIIVQINETPVIVDLKSGYGHEMYGTYTKQTVGHNTVVVDEVAQMPQGDTAELWAVDESVHGEPVLFYSTDEIKAARARSTVAYDGVVVDRTVVMVDSMLIDIYRCRSDEEHQYDYVLHVDGQLVTESLPNAEAMEGPLGEKFGYSLHSNVVTGTVPTDAPIRYETVAETPMNIHPVVADSAMILTADGPVFKDSTVTVTRNGETLTLVSTEACNVTVVDNDTVLAEEDRPLILTRESASE